MAIDVRIYHRWSSVIGSVALGAAAMYAFDPDKGRRRRAVARDKAHGLLVDTRHAAGATTRDIAHRLAGLHARVRRYLIEAPNADDLQLIERVRARMGRAVSHPHAVQVGALHGRVTLSGPALAHEVAPLVSAVRSVWGVRHVENLLVAHEDPASVPGLQGGSGRALARYEHWPPALRAAALSAGILVALTGARRRSIVGVLVAAAGLALALRGVTNRPLAQYPACAPTAERPEAPDADDATPRDVGGQPGFDDTAARRWRALH